MATMAMDKESVRVVRKLFLFWQRESKKLGVTWKNSERMTAYYNGKESAFRQAAKTLRRLYQNPILPATRTGTGKTPSSSDGATAG